MTKHYKSILAFNQKESHARLYLDLSTGESFTVVLEDKQRNNLAFTPRSVIALFLKTKSTSYSLNLKETNDYITDFAEAYDRSNYSPSTKDLKKKLDKSVGVEDPRIFVQESA